MTRDLVATTPGLPRHATYGLPPTQTVERAHRVIDEWDEGTTVWTSWNDAADEARHAFASLAGARADTIAVGPSTSGFVGLVAASLPDSAEVVVPAGEFTSLLFPLLVQDDRGVVVREVPLEALADSVSPQTTVVAWSAVQSSDGRLAERRGDRGGARVRRADDRRRHPGDGLAPVAARSRRRRRVLGVQVVVLSRGTAFMVASSRVLADLRPHAASWFAAEDMHAGYYGTPLRLAQDARRFDMTPAWFAWMGAVSSLRALTEIGVEAIHDHDVRLADDLRDGIGLEPGGSAIVSIGGDDLEEALASGGSGRRRVPTAAGSRSTSTTTTTTSPLRWPPCVQSEAIQNPSKIAAASAASSSHGPSTVIGTLPRAKTSRLDSRSVGVPGGTNSINCSPDRANTSRPMPAQYWPVAHMAQLSQLV